jgi:hypothetical protein
MHKDIWSNPATDLSCATPALHPEDALLLLFAGIAHAEIANVINTIATAHVDFFKGADIFFIAKSLSFICQIGTFD